MKPNRREALKQMAAGVAAVAAPALPCAAPAVLPAINDPWPAPHFTARIVGSERTPRGFSLIVELKRVA